MLCCSCCQHFVAIVVVVAVVVIAGAVIMDSSKVKEGISLAVQNQGRKQPSINVFLVVLNTVHHFSTIFGIVRPPGRGTV